MHIGIIGFQGAIQEHLKITRRALKELNLKGSVKPVKSKPSLNGVDGLILPGGESTTIGKLMKKSGIFEKIRDMGQNGIPMLGTCAGMIILAKEGGPKIEKTNQPMLGLMNIKVKRNAFGRQKESFEAELDMKIPEEETFRGVFIRAPAAENAGDNAEVLAKYNDKIVAVEQDNLLALSFHPELTKDTRLHEYYLKKVDKFKREHK